MAVRSAGLLIYRRRNKRLEVFLIHPGGPFWARRDEGSWSIPKGEYGPEEAPLDAARREFTEETGWAAPKTCVPLGDVRQKAGKIVSAWAAEGDFDPATLKSNTFEMEWPRNSGNSQEFPEVDRGDWFTMERAMSKILPAQAPLLERLSVLLTTSDG